MDEYYLNFMNLIIIVRCNTLCMTNFPLFMSYQNVVFTWIFICSAPKRLPAVPESVLKRRKARSAFKLKQLKKAIEVCNIKLFKLWCTGLINFWVHSYYNIFIHNVNVNCVSVTVFWFLYLYLFIQNKILTNSQFKEFLSKI